MLKLDIQMFAEEDGKVIIGTELDSTGFEDGLDGLDDIAKGKGTRIGDIFSKAFNKFMPKIKSTIKSVFSGLTSITGTLLKTVSSIANGILSLGGGIGFISALLGGLVAGALILKNAFERISLEQIRTNLQYIIFAIEKSLEPAINSVANFMTKVLNLIIQIIRYTALFINLWTGKNVFAEATADNFAKKMASAEKSTKKTAKNAKEIKNQLAGFDEMNVLSDNKGSGATDTGAGAGITMPSFDLSNLSDLETPEWMKWIVENKDLVIAGLVGIASALLLVKLGLTGLFGGIIVGLIVALVALIIQNWDTIKDTLGEVWGWVDEHIIQPVVKLFMWLWEKIKEIFSPVIAFFVSIFSTVWTNIQVIISNVITIVRTLWNTIIGVLKPIASWIWNNVLSPVVNFFRSIIDTIWGLIKTIATTVGNVIASVFKGVINGVLGAIETILNSPIKAINKLINVINDVPGISLNKLSTFKLPRLAKGGIVNNPGPGVMMGSYVAGEQGPEAVLPLTDEVLDRLGEAIARHQNINATIPVYVGNRQIARELRKINAEDNFAFNN